MKYKRSLQNEIILSFVLLTLIPSFIGGGLALIYARQSLEKVAQKELRSTTQLWGTSIQQWSDAAALEVQLLAFALESSRSEARIKEAVMKMRYAGLWQLDQDFTIVETIQPGTLPTALDWKATHVYQGVELGAIQKLSDGHAVLPIRAFLPQSPERHLLALLHAHKIPDLSEDLVEPEAAIGFLLNDEGALLDFDRGRELMSEERELVSNCQDQQFGSGVFENEQGQDMVLAFRWLEFPGACLLVEQELDSTLGYTAGQLPLLLLLIEFGIIGISLLIARFLARRLLQPIRELIGVVHRVAEGDFTGKPTDSPLEEIQKLHRAFIDMANSLETYNRFLEERVSQRTLELSERNLQLRETMRQLEEERKKQLQQAYNAGMVEHAISVLHNIGNAITPLVVRVQKLHKEKAQSQLTVYLRQLCDLLSQHEQDLTTFFASPRGQQFLPFLRQLTQTSQEQAEEEMKTMDNMSNQLAHITEIIALQQKYAHHQGVEEELQIVEVIEDALEMMQPAFDKRNIQVQREFAANLPKMKNDSNKLVQIFMNFFKNSIESIDQQLQQDDQPHFEGRIRVEAKLLEDRQLQLTVEDNGSGADPDTLLHAFEFGFSTKKRGSGFGLHDCANFIRSHKGQIEITSPGLGQGARVSFTLPLAKPANSED